MTHNVARPNHRRGQLCGEGFLRQLVQIDDRKTSLGSTDQNEATVFPRGIGQTVTISEMTHGGNAFTVR